MIWSFFAGVWIGICICGTGLIVRALRSKPPTKWWEWPLVPLFWLLMPAMFVAAAVVQATGGSNDPHGG